MSKVVAITLVCLVAVMPTVCEGRAVTQPNDQNQSSHGRSIARSVPNVSGDWQGDASCGGRTLSVTMSVMQADQSITGTLTSTGDDGVSIHQFKGNFIPGTKQFICEDVSVNKVHGASNLVPSAVKRYELRLSADRASLVGSAILDGDATINLALTKTNVAEPHSAERAINEQLAPVIEKEAPLSQLSRPVAGMPQGATNRACLLCQQGRDLRAANKLDESRVLLEQACLLDPNPNSAAVHDNLGVTLLMMGNPEDAISEFSKALSFDPKLPSAEMNIAEGYKEIGQIEQSMSYLKQFISDHPDSPKIEAVRALLKTLRATPKKPIADIAIGDYIASVTAKGPNRWARERMPIRVFIRPGDGVKGYRDDFRPMIFRSMRQWIQAAHGHLTWRAVLNEKEADLVFSWTDDHRDFPHGAEQGLAKTVCLSPHCIKHAEIKLLTVPLSPDTNQTLSDDEMESTCLHEIGHALGLHGHSPNNKDVMFFCIHPNPITSLTDRDKATIAILYSSEQHEYKSRPGIGVPGLFRIGF